MEFPKIISLNNPKSPMTEAYRTLRTNIQFSSLDKKIQSILITSSGPGEGKTSTSSNLAVLMAMGGHKTILIDCDQRKPNIHRIFNISNENGLSNLLIGQATMEEALCKTEVDNLFIITSGTKSPNPSELLESSKMKSFINSLRAEYEYIIIDTPPLLMVTDAQILSQYSDGCLLVVSSGESHREAAIKAKDLLMKVNAKILGVVLNKITKSSREYSYGNYNNYYYGSNEEKKDKKHRKNKKSLLVNQ